MSEKKEAESRLIQAQCNLIATRDAHKAAELEQLRAGRALAEIEALEAERRKEAGIVAMRELRSLSHWFENDCDDRQGLVSYGDVSDKIAEALGRVELALGEPRRCDNPECDEACRKLHPTPNRRS